MASEQGIAMDRSEYAGSMTTWDEKPQHREAGVQARDGVQHQIERLEKAVAVLSERVQEIMAPSEPCAVPDENAKMARASSPHVGWIESTAENLRNLAVRLEAITDRIDL